MEFKQGDLIFLREKPAKHKVREMFTVVDLKNDLLIVKKTEGQFRSNSISIRKQEAVKVNTPSNRMDKEDVELDTEEENNTDVETDPNKSEPIEIPHTRPKRKAANISQRKTKEMMGMLRRLCASQARYAWVYVPGSEDEQYDVVCLPVSDMNEFNLELLFNSSDSDSSMELDKGEPTMR